MGSPELAQYADFYADMTRRFGLTDSLELWRDISERLHQLTPEPEGVTYRDVTANGVPAILVMPADTSPDHILLHSHSGGSVTASMWQERKAVGHLAKAAGSRALVSTTGSRRRTSSRRRSTTSRPRSGGCSTKGTTRPGSPAPATRSAGTTR